MTDRPARLLHEGTRCLLACSGGPGPMLTPTAYWFDGRQLWMTTAADSAQARRLAEDPGCSVCVPAGEAWVVASGEARVFAITDPVRLALHAGPISGALAGLAAHNAAALLGSALGVALEPARLRPRNRVVVRVRVGEGEVRPAPRPGPGVAPPLPPSVPPDVRRALAGRRQVVVAHGSGPPALDLATWDAGFALTAPDGSPLPVVGPVAVAAYGEAEDEPPGVRGLVLQGGVADGRLQATRVTWWREFELETVDLPPAPARGVVLPD